MPLDIPSLRSAIFVVFIESLETEPLMACDSDLSSRTYRKSWRRRRQSKSTNWEKNNGHDSTLGSSRLGFDKYRARSEECERLELALTELEPSQTCLRRIAT